MRGGSEGRSHAAARLPFPQSGAGEAVAVLAGLSALQEPSVQSFSIVAKWPQAQKCPVRRASLSSQEKGSKG